MNRPPDLPPLSSEDRELVRDLLIRLLTIIVRDKQPPRDTGAGW